MKLTVLKSFRWAHRGVDVKHYAADDVIDTDEHADGGELATVALVEGWVEEGAADDVIDTDEHADGGELATVALVEGWVEEGAAGGKKAKGAAPENK